MRNLTCPASIIDQSQSTVDTMKRLSVLIALFLFSVAGCGQSGPLYIADNPSEIYQAEPGSAPAAEQEEDDNDD